jgi:glucan phosphoethanolaminetransferase (alkaline phosphatase superfamily)
LFKVFARRFLVAVLLVCLTLNPSGYSYVSWAAKHVGGAVNTGWTDERRTLALVAFVGVVLLIGWLFYLRTTARSLGAVGVILAAGLCATVYWVLATYGVVGPQNGTVLLWLSLVLFSAILAMGMSWSHARRIWAGQTDVDEIDHR